MHEMKLDVDAIALVSKSRVGLFGKGGFLEAHRSQAVIYCRQYRTIYLARSTSLDHHLFSVLQCLGLDKDRVKVFG